MIIKAVKIIWFGLRRMHFDFSLPVLFLSRCLKTKRGRMLKLAQDAVLNCSKPLKHNNITPSGLDSLNFSARIGL